MHPPFLIWLCRGVDGGDVMVSCSYMCPDEETCFFFFMTQSGRTGWEVKCVFMDAGMKGG